MDSSTVLVCAQLVFAYLAKFNNVIIPISEDDIGTIELSFELISMHLTFGIIVAVCLVMAIIILICYGLRSKKQPA